MESLPVIVVEDVAPAPASEPQMIEEVIDAPKCARQAEQDMMRQQERRNNKSADPRTRRPSSRRGGLGERVAV